MRVSGSVRGGRACAMPIEKHRVLDEAMTLMLKARVFTLLLTAAAALACEGGSRSNSAAFAPSPPTPVSTSSTNGRIAAVSIQPDSGATMTVIDCQSTDGTNRTSFCAEQFRGLFEVMADRSARNPVLTVSFYDGNQLCGYAAATAAVLVADQPLVFGPSVVHLTMSEACALPLTTTRMVAEAWSDADWEFSLKGEFANRYTFRKP